MDVGEIAIPTHFWFLISLDLMKDPVTLSTGITYDRSSIEKWIETGNNTCSVTNQELMSFDQILNHALCRIIQDWCVENKSYGIERIPMPRILVIPYEVSRIRERIMGAARHLNEKKCRELVGKIKEWGKESVRRRNLLADEHTAPLGEWRRLRVSVVLLLSSRARSGKPLSGRSWSGKTHFGQGSSGSSEREG
ncbi:hypothetical protein TB2_047088 [Malus domestica]